MSSHSPAHLQRSSWTAGKSVSCRPRDGIVIRGSSRLLALRPRLVLGNTGLDDTSNDRNGNPLLRREMDAPVVWSYPFNSFANFRRNPDVAPKRLRWFLNAANDT